MTIQAQILELIRLLQEEMHMSVVFITHDMGVVAEVADRVLVMYRGEIVEDGTAIQIFDAPRHPYTRALLAAVPRLGFDARQRRAGAVPAARWLASASGAPRPPSSPCARRRPVRRC